MRKILVLGIFIGWSLGQGLEIPNLYGASDGVAELKAMVQELSERVVSLEAKLREKESQGPGQQPVGQGAAGLDQSPVLLAPVPIGPDPRGGKAEPQIVATKSAKDDPQVVTSGNDRIKLAVSGHVNRGVLLADNGPQSKFFHVDNDNSSTRFKFAGLGRVNNDFSVGTQIIMQVESNSSRDVDIKREKSSGPVITDRNLEVYFDSKAYGRLWVGKGSTASDFTSEIDLSGTSIVADGASIEELAGGISFHNGNDPETPGPRIKEVWTAFDGLGRRDRVRYDTPNFHGFVFGVSHADTDSYDIAVKFAGEHGGTKMKAGFAAANDNPDFVQYNGSMSILLSGGVSATVALGDRHYKREEKKKRRHSNLAFGKLGYQREWFEIGKTALAADYGEVRRLDEGGDKMRSYGVFLVQKVDIIAAEFYWGWRWHRLSRREADFKTITASLLGVRVKF